MTIKLCDVTILRYLKNASLNFYDLHQVTKTRADNRVVVMEIVMVATNKQTSIRIQSTEKRYRASDVVD